MKRILLTCVSLMLLLMTTVAFAQDKTVSGKVTGSDDGLPLPQVTILVKGTTNGTASDLDGNYSLSVPSGATLVFRYLGYVTQEILVGNQSVINVPLVPDATSLGEVVVTGVAAATPEKKLSFSISKVDETLLQQVPQTDAGSALRGKVAGVKVRSGGAPLSDPSFQIRGAAQLRTSNSPLIVVDGILIEGSLSDINMQDVENIEVLKGASAASLFGSRAANGVINITTRRGNNNANGETRVRFRNEIGQDFLYNSRANDKTTSHHFLTNPDGSIQTADGGNGFNLGISDPDQIQDKPFPNGTTDHLKQFFQGNSFWTSYVQITSNYGSGNLAASFENTLTGGVVPMNDGGSRQNLRVNLDQFIGEKLKLSVTSLYGLKNRDVNFGGGQGTRGTLRNLFMMDPSADLLANNDDGTPYRWNVNKFGNSESNPLYTLSRLVSEQEDVRFLGNLRLSYEIADGLNVEYSASIDQVNSHNYSYLPKNHLDISASQNAAIGSRNDSFSDQTAIISTATISYVKSFNDWNVRTRAFYQYEDNQSRSWSLGANQQNFENIFTYNNYVTTNPLTSGESQITANNFAVALAGDYKNKYIADLIVRYEGVSLFGANQRYQTFYRGSFNYRISEDVSIPGFQELSLRGSYGTSGNRPGFSDQYELFPLGSAGNVNTSGGQLGNPDLKNAVTTEYEISVRADFLDRFSLLASYSSQENADQILAVPVSAAATGFGSQIQNAGTVEGNSLEFTLDYEAIRSEDLGLTFGLVFDRYRGEITEFNRRDQIVGLNIWRAGAKIGDLYGQKLVRSLSELTTNANGIVLNESNGGTIADYSVNAEGFVVRTSTIGTATESVLYYVDDAGARINDELLGNATPNFNLGLNTTLRYKDLSVYMLWSYQDGGLVYNQSDQWLARDLIHPMFDQRGKADGDKKTTAYYLGIYNVNNTNDYWIEDATNLRLAELAVNYNFSRSTLDRMGLGNIFKAAKISAIGRNLLLLSKYGGFDPEVGNLQRPVDDFSYPLVRTFTGTLDLTF